MLSLPSEICFFITEQQTLPAVDGLLLLRSSSGEQAEQTSLYQVAQEANITVHTQSSQLLYEFQQQHYRKMLQKQLQGIPTKAGCRSHAFKPRLVTTQPVRHVTGSAYCFKATVQQEGAVIFKKIMHTE